MRILTIKRRTIIIFLCVLVCLVMIGVYFGLKTTSAQPNIKPTIVIDAGHGGRDGGAVGKTTGVTESLLNLQFALKLKDLCENYNFNVVLTRKDMNGLYSAFATNKKKSEMQKRQEIIESANPDVVISLHMNSFPVSSSRGAQVFYAEGNESGKVLGESVQNALHNEIDYAKSVAKVGDFYVLNCTDKAGILVECGFLSNAEEEVLLQQEDYQEKFCYAILYGILTYFSM